MKILFLSDTHEQHRQLTDLPKADMIIHGGDISGLGRAEKIDNFIDWYSHLDYQYKIFIAGNHDFYFEEYSQEEIQKKLPENMYYLNDSGICIEGNNIWGSPITPTFFNWAFNKDRGYDIIQHWQQIPDNTDILITHGPPNMILDKTQRGVLAGCRDLLETIIKIKPKFHLFGHIHEAYGVYKSEDTVFINGSVLDHKYRLKNKPVLFEI